MGVNVYFSSGLMSAISASVVAEKLHTSEINVLCVERVINVFGEDYYKINKMVESFFPWDKIFYVDIEARSWGTKHENFIKYYKSIYEVIRYYKSFKPYINKNLCEFNSIDQVYAPMPSRLWSLIKNKKAKINVIEHSIQEYNLLYSIRDCYYPITRLKRFIDNLIGYRYICRTIPSKFVLLDGGRCNLLKKRPFGRAVPLISIDASSLIRRIFKHVEKEYQILYSKDYQEIADIKDQMNTYKNRYIYLPTGEVPSNEYKDYLEYQVRDISLDNTCILVKNHPADLNDYLRYLKSYDCKVFTLKHKINHLLPVEILMALLDMPTLWGSYSSSLMYSYWWLGAVPVLSAVACNSVNKMYLYEYKGFIESDFYRFKVNW